MNMKILCTCDVMPMSNYRVLVVKFWSNSWLECCFITVL